MSGNDMSGVFFFQRQSNQSNVSLCGSKFEFNFSLIDMFKRVACSPKRNRIFPLLQFKNQDFLQNIVVVHVICA